jgi:hypothetical protein
MSKAYNRRIAILFVTCIIFGIVSLYTLNYVVYHSLEEVRNSYAIPDTTITYSGGKYDTIIVQKSVPSWLK